MINPHPSRSLRIVNDCPVVLHVAHHGIRNRWLIQHPLQYVALLATPWNSRRFTNPVRQPRHVHRPKYRLARFLCLKFSFHNLPYSVTNRTHCQILNSMPIPLSFQYSNNCPITGFRITEELGRRKCPIMSTPPCKGGQLLDSADLEFRNRRFLPPLQ